MNIEKILADHKKWLDDSSTGKQANLRGANLRYADLRGADLRKANLQSADLQSADLRGADLRKANLRDADLRGANLRGADLRGADLRGANLDLSCFPLWCGSFSIKVDQRLLSQLCYHLLRLTSDEPDFKKLKSSKLLKNVANKFHRKELPRL
jgi:hypothetical protein